ncbi:MAG: 4Fe-4S ferredoxin [Desulfovibrionaceae bacterium]|nr:4Fe-4S ferredoxin [Desulfovibrionaceae bacterium]
MTAEAEEKSRKKVAWAALMPAALFLACLLFAAHLMRAGNFAGAATCILWSLACFLRESWMRYAAIGITGFFAWQWLDAAPLMVQLRIMQQLPFYRLLAILSTVLLVNMLALALCFSPIGKAWFYKNKEHAFAKAGSFLGVILLMQPALRMNPPMLLADRLFYGAGSLQVLIAALVAAFVAGQLLNRETASRTRRRIWLLFSVVFFLQFALMLAGLGFFATTGSLHIPVPGVILAGAVYNQKISFMPCLFLFSVLLAGPAWCSHLCYFGSWDYLASRQKKKPCPHPHPLRWRLLSLVVITVSALLLRMSGVPILYACLGGILLGFLMVPVSLFLSRKKGIPVYCTMICPLGLAACLAGRLSLWRMKTTKNCIQCRACLPSCRYGALNPEQLQKGQAGLSCTLCRECELACKNGGIRIAFVGENMAGAKSGKEPWARQLFVAVVSAMQAAFLFMAMV